MAELKVTRVNEPVRLINVDVLKRCRSGLTRRIIKSHFNDRVRLQIIRDEIDYLINQL